MYSLHCNFWHEGHPQSTKKCCFFWKSDPLTEKIKISLWSNSCGHQFTYFCQVLWKSVKHKWPERYVMFLTEKNYLPLPPGPESDFAKNFTGSPFPHSSSLCQVSSKSIQFPGRYKRKCRVESSQYHCEGYRLLANNNSNKSRYGRITVKRKLPCFQ